MAMFTYQQFFFKRWKSQKEGEEIEKAHALSQI